LPKSVSGTFPGPASTNEELSQRSNYENVGGKGSRGKNLMAGKKKLLHFRGISAEKKDSKHARQTWEREGAPGGKVI